MSSKQKSPEAVGARKVLAGVRDWLRRVRRAGRSGAGQLLRAPVVAVEEYRIRYELAVCLKFKNAAPFLAEWVEFHLLVGFEHCYLYNNNSADDYLGALEPYLRAGLVTLTEWPESPICPKADEDCVARHGHEARWIAFLDDDEFLFPSTGTDVRKVLRGYRQYPGIAVHWLMFGSSGHIQRPAGLVIENYLRRQKCVNSTIKSIINPRKVISCKGPHSWRYKNRELPVDEKRSSVKGSTSTPATVDTLRINHYWSKSLEDGRIKVTKGVPDPWSIENPRSMDVWHEYDRVLNEIEDREILRFLPELKQRLEARRKGAI